MAVNEAVRLADPDASEDEEDGVIAWRHDL
jgi:hypothetical protein